MKEQAVKIAPGIYHRFKVVLNNTLNSMDSKIESKWDKFAGGATDTDMGNIEISGTPEVVSSPVNIPSKFSLNNGKVLDQGSTMWCVGVGSAEAHNEGANIVGIENNVDYPSVVSYIRDNLDPNIDKVGTYIINGPIALSEMGLIDEYYTVNSLDSMKKAIYIGGGLCTGSNKISWSKTNKNGVAVNQSGGGHFINGVGWDNNIELNDGFGNNYTGALEVENTWGESWGINGRYWIPYELIEKVLFNTRLGLIVDTEASQKRLENIQAESVEVDSDYTKAVDLGYINGERPDDNIIRKDVGRIAYRIHKEFDERLKKLEEGKTTS